MSDEKIKGKVGKPKGYEARPITQEDIDRIEKFAAVGLTNDQMSALLGISPATFDRRIQKNKALKAAILKGRSNAIFNVGVSAYQQAVSGKTPAMTMFYLKCRAGWKETVVNEHMGKDGDAINLSFTEMVKRVASKAE